MRFRASEEGILPWPRPGLETLRVPNPVHPGRSEDAALIAISEQFESMTGSFPGFEIR